MKTLLLLAVLGAIGSVSFQAKARDDVLIKAITYNTWMIPFLRKDAKARANVIGRKMGDGGYDLVMLQEMFPKRYRNVVKRLYRERNQGFLDFRLPAVINSGLTTLARHKVEQTDFRRYRACGGWQCLAKKGVQFTRFKIDQDLSVDVYNTHLQPFEDGLVIRQYQLKELRRFMERNSTEGNPVILAGDFNTIAEAPEYLDLVGRLPDFVDAWAVKRGTDPGYSWDPLRNGYAKPDRGTDYVKQRVDYIFLRDGADWSWKVESIGLEFTEPLPYRNGSYFGSDHFAVGAKLRLFRN